MLKIKLIAALCALSMLSGIALSGAELAASEIVPDTDKQYAATSNSASAEKVQDVVYQYLTEELELTPAAAAGIMGNIMIECTFDPTALAMDTNGLYSFGLMMWNGPRFEALKKWCSENGYEKEDPLGQLGYLKWELLNTEKAAYAAMKDIPNTIEGACQAAILWASEFERCTRTSYGLRIYYALNLYWPKYAGGTVSDNLGIYGYYYNVPENIQYGKPLTLFGAVVSFSSNIKSITVGVFTEDGQLVTGRTIDHNSLVGNIGVLDNYIIFNKVPKGKYYYTITAVNEAGEYIVERHPFTVSDEPTTHTLIKETVGYAACGFGANCPGHVFSDMPPASNWAHGSIDYVVNAGLFEGHPGGLFAPDESMSRAMFVTVLCRLGDMFDILDRPEISENTDNNDTAAASSDESASSAENETEQSQDESTSDAAGEDPAENPFFFQDVPDGKWYTQSVYRAAAAQLVLGKSADTFAPNEPVTRAELAIFMYRFAQLFSADTTLEADFTGFADSDAVPSWASREMSWAVAAGLINGSKSGDALYLAPAEYATRAQVAAIIQRFVIFIQG